ncbi:Aldo/keto reductase [Penicillium expansum]|nr:Aldo/keto reductase [Penicillium expansum]
MFDLFQRHGHSGVDTSRVYRAGSSEEYLGDSQWKAHGLKVQTKVYPTARKGLENLRLKYSRFDPKRRQGGAQQGRYWNEAYFDALDIIRSVAKIHGLTESECAFRWLSHHSGLDREFGDAVLKGSLPEEVVQALNDRWLQVKGGVFKYWR